MAEAIQHKICTKCQLNLPFSSFGKHPKCAGGLNTQCKKCRAAYVAKWASDNAERRAAKSKEWRERSKDRNRATAKARYDANKPEISEKRRARYRNNIEKESQTVAKWQAANRGKRLANGMAYYHSHKAAMDEYGAKWFADHPGASAFYSANHRANQRRATPPWVDRNELFKFYEKAALLTIETGITHEVDHIYPLDHPLCCGLHVPWNLQILTKLQNRKKGNRLPV